MAESLRRYGQVFDGVAEAYDRHRSGYPAELVDVVLERAGVSAGLHVVEVGCGTGKLTELLVGRGLRVEAVDPGSNMVAMARRRVGGSDLVRFHVSRFEDVELPGHAFDAVVSAIAFHWVDPALGWAKAASLLRPGGSLNLVQRLPVYDDESAVADDAFREALTRLAPEITADWPPLRDEATLLAGVEERRSDISEVWTWIGHHELQDDAAARLFGEASFATVSERFEQTADELWAVFGTTSLYHRLSLEVRERFRADVERIADRLGGRVASTQLLLLASARRRPD